MKNRLINERALENQKPTNKIVETAINKIERMLNPESESEKGTLFEQLYDSYQECLDNWNKPRNMEILKNTSPTSTPKEHCDVLSEIK